MIQFRFHFCLAAGLTILAIAGCNRRGVLEQAIVTGPSMGSSFPGEHRKANCPNCRFPIVCDADRGPDSGQVFCPMCGDMSIEWAAMPKFPGAQCVIDTGIRHPGRWDVVAINLPEPETGQRFGIKRVLGLPGETISFRDGNLFVNGLIVRKSIGEQRLLWQTVFDSAFLAEGRGLLDHFSPTVGGDRASVGADAGSWREAGSRLVFEPGNPDARRELLGYVHRPEYPQPVPQASGCLIRDHWSYNQGVSSTMLPVCDLAIGMMVDGATGAELGIVFHFDKSFSLTVVLRFERADQWTVWVDGPDQSRIPVSRNGRSSVSLLASVIDHRCVVQIDGETVIDLPVTQFLDGDPESVDDTAIPLPQLELLASGGRLEIGEIRIWRDPMLVWADPIDGPLDKGRKVTIPAGYYFVIGDNLPVSRDSRNWRDVFVPESAILGLVKKPE